MLIFLVAILILTLGVFLAGVFLGFINKKLSPTENNLVEQIDEILPQTQCGQCGYPGCKPYAEAIANGDAINKCPPGGQETIERLAEFLGVPAEPIVKESTKKVAYIIEDDCIGCTKCITACPVDAIVGARKLMHTVIKDDCTGCDLCVDPCPVDCIKMLPVPVTTDTWDWGATIPVKNIN